MDTIDQLKSSPSLEDQMDMMMMMMMQLPEFSAGCGDDTVEGFPQPELCVAANSIRNSNTMPWSSLTHLPSTTISFTNYPTTPMLQQQEQNPSSMMSHEGLSLSGANPYGTVTSEKRNSMREMIFRIAAMQPVHIDPESVKPPKRRNVKISKDPQSVAARHRRERIRILQRLVPGGTKMDTASMLDEAIHYVKFLKTQVQSLERAASNNTRTAAAGIGFPVAMSSATSAAPYLSLPKTYHARNVGIMEMHDKYI